MRLDRLLREEQAFTDLSVDESVRNELQYLDLTGSRIRAELTSGRRTEWDYRAAPATAASCCGSLEAATVVPIAVEDLLTLGGVHASGIGARSVPL